MLVALLTAHLDSGFFAADGGIELVLVLGAATLALAATGPGRFSLDGAFGLSRRFVAALHRLAVGRLTQPSTGRTARPCALSATSCASRRRRVSSRFALMTQWAAARRYDGGWAAK